MAQLVVLVIMVLLVHDAVLSENTSTDGEQVKGPEIRLYRDHNIKSKGQAVMPEEVDAEPGHVEQAISNLYGHEPNCARAPLERASDLYSSEDYFPEVGSILVLHDRCGSASDLWVTGILEALSMRNFWSNYNILAVDVPEFMCGLLDKLQDLVGMKTALDKTAEQLVTFLKKGVEANKLRLEQVHVIGLGIGAQLAGQVGRGVGGRIGSITGLDPTKFANVPQVSKDDAQTVHLLHTDSRHLGTADRLGTADFVFNGAEKVQEMCESKEGECSHTRCFKIFTAAITFSSRFQAWRCDSWEKFSSGGDSCAQDYGFITFPPDIKLRGTYYLRVRRSFPYGVGEDGRKFDEQTIKSEQMPGYKPKVNGPHGGGATPGSRSG